MATKPPLSSQVTVDQHGERSFALLPPEGVPVRFNIAGLGSRFGALCLDILITYGGLVLLLLAIFAVFNLEISTWVALVSLLGFIIRTDCAEGVIIQRQLFDDLAVARTMEPALTPIELVACEAFYDDTDALLTSFVAHLRGDATLECSGRDHLYTLALCFAAIESSQQGAAVKMSDFYARHNIPAP